MLKTHYTIIMHRVFTRAKVKQIGKIASPRPIGRYRCGDGPQQP